jgi:hypothetical protein
MSDRLGSPFRVRTSKDKVHRKDLYGSVRAVYVLEKLPDVSGPDLVEAGRYNKLSSSPLFSLPLSLWPVGLGCQLSGAGGRGRAGRVGLVGRASRTSYRAAQGHRASPVAGWEFDYGFIFVLFYSFSQI